MLKLHAREVPMERLQLDARQVHPGELPTSEITERQAGYSSSYEVAKRKTEKSG